MMKRRLFVQFLMGAVVAKSLFAHAISDTTKAITNTFGEMNLGDYFTISGEMLTYHGDISRVFKVVSFSETAMEVRSV